MRAGRLNKRVRFEAPASVTADKHGGQVITWEPLATQWAAVEPLNGREFFQAQGENSSVEVRIRVRYTQALAALAPNCRAIYRGTAYNIVSVIDPQEQHSELTIMCEAGERLG
ncbi:phage head closure protein [Alloalcanivorax sp. C16-1]|uniref:phage head closure protein n=1 Tax=Alloalcanivorax sp. C16-1 TaxID=3390051 RepID=UPI0039705768